MSEDKHTPGPWEFVPAGNKPVVQCSGHFPHGFICTVESKNFVSDARLIAAAPDLLAALKHMVIQPDEWVNEARAAISKAEGRE